LEVLSEIPQVTFQPGPATHPLTLGVQAVVSSGADVSWDFGDGSGFTNGASQEHSYAKPGRYTVTLRVVRNGRLSQFNADVPVSRNHRLIPPVTAFPSLTRDTTSADIPSGHTRIVALALAADDDAVTAIWRLGDQSGRKGKSASFDLKPGRYTVHFTAIRTLKARMYGKQRYITGPLFDFSGLSLTTNRRFDLNGADITGVGSNPAANAFATHLFGSGALSPIDEWTVEFPLSDNPCLRSVGTTDAEQYGLAEIQDVVLALEYETTPGSS
jgi:hypothetical protein